MIYILTSITPLILSSPWLLDQQRKLESWDYRRHFGD